MKIKFLNKNLTHTNSNEGWFECTEAPVFTEVKNETLDSGTVVLSNLTSPIDIEPYDVVEIDEFTDKYMCVDTYTEQMMCVSPKLYKYEISLFSETKQLENTVLPNLKITSLKTGEKRTVYDYIEQYMNEYCPKVRIATNDGYEYQNKFTWLDTASDARSLRRFRTIDCPEMQWNTPTLREVLNDLMMVDDCIPVLRKGILTFIDLTQITLSVGADSYINYISKSRSSEDYVSELQVKLENVTNNIDGVNNFVTVTEYVPYGIPDDSATMTTENIVLKTKCPIYNLKSVKIKFAALGLRSLDTTDIQEWFEADLTNLFGYGINLILEYQKWITKDIVFNEEPPSDIADWPKYQNWSLYYTRGSNEIKNFYSKTKYIFVTNYLIQALLAGIVKAKLGWSSMVFPVGSPAQVCQFYDVLFKVEYETLDGCLFRASKNNYPEHDRVIIDNQTNSMVDSYLQGFLEYQKANRLGNEQLQINARYPASYTGHKISIGDFYEDSIVYQCQYQYFKDHTEVNAIATKDYVLRDYFTGVKSKLRSWKIVSGSEALVRHDLEKFYCEFSWTPHIESDGLDVFGEDNDISGYFISPLTTFNQPSPVKYGYIKSKWTDSSDDDYYYPDSDRYYAVDLMTRIVGNSLVFTFEMTDNYSAGTSVYTEEDDNGEDNKYISKADFHLGEWAAGGGIQIDTNKLLDGGVPMYQHKYANENGEFDEIRIIYADNIKTVPVDGVNEPTEFETYVGFDGESGFVSRASEEFFYACLQRPVVHEKSIKSSTNNPAYNYQQFNVVSYHKKDSQEITNISTQIEFCSDTTNICIGKEWLKRQKAVKLTKNNPAFVLRGYKLFSNQRFNFRKPNELPTAYDSTAGGDVTISYDSDTHTNSNITLKITTSSGGSFNSADAAKRFIRSRSNWSWYLIIKSENNGGITYDTGEEPILLAFTDIPNDNVTAVEYGSGYEAEVSISMNVLKSRNKNIYNSDNHYLIEDEI